MDDEHHLAPDESFEEWKRKLNEEIRHGIEELDRGEWIPESGSRKANWMRIWRS